MRKRKVVGALVEPPIVIVREQRVVLDAELARIYGVTTKRLNEAVKRNQRRFPDDFAFQLSTREVENLKSQIATSSSGHGGRRSHPWAFTEHGALMAANILRSERAIEMSVYVVRAFVRQREQLATNEEIMRKFEQIDHRLLEHDQALVIVWEKIKELMRTPPPSLPPLPPKLKPRIGFHQ
jgi:hypothetical protein